MKALFLAALLGALGTGAVAKERSAPPEPDEKPNWTEIRNQGEREIRLALFDPSSAQIRYTNKFHWGYTNKDFKEWGWVTCGIYNAKNRLGGYTGEKVFVIFNRNGRTSVSYPYWKYKTSCSEQDDTDIQSELLAPSSVFPSHPGSGTLSVADEIAKLAALKDRGVITDAEFAAGKQKLLGQIPR